MPRHEHDREDLMREAVALTRRIELVAPDEPEPVTAGWRENGWFSIYFGQDPAFTFDEAGRLRRAYADGFLYRTQGTTLARLERTRDETGTKLVRHDLSNVELDAFLGAMGARLRTLRTSLAERAVEVLRSTGDGAALLEAVAGSLEQILRQHEPLAPPIAAR